VELLLMIIIPKFNDHITQRTLMHKITKEKK
jgi:hypothetical protein